MLIQVRGVVPLQLTETPVVIIERYIVPRRRGRRGHVVAVAGDGGRRGRRWATVGDDVGAKHLLALVRLLALV